MLRKYGARAYTIGQHFKEKYGEKDLTVIAIGQVGEVGQVRLLVNENDRASGRGGTGCVGGSKNLKRL